MASGWTDGAHLRPHCLKFDGEDANLVLSSSVMKAHTHIFTHYFLALSDQLC